MDITDKLNMTMLCDFYELTMGNGYLEAGLKDRITYFDIFFRDVPDHGGYAICAGLERIIAYIQDLHFSEEDIEYLRSKDLFSERFLDYLRDFKFTGDVWAIPEGTPIFPREPIITVRAPAIQAQLVETFLLLIFNHQSLVATKTNRIVRAAEGRVILEFGSRRAQGTDAAISGARAAYIGGCAGTACTISDQLFGVPAGGTMAHAWVQMFDSEYEAFKTYCEVFPTNATLLVDTYNTLKSGVPNAIKAFNEVLRPKGITKCAIRLDSGDIAYLTREARQMLDEAGWESCKISASNSLEEDGTIVPKIKISENVGKITNPHFKKVYRIFDKATGKAEADYITVWDEVIEEGQPLELFDPDATWKRRTYTDYTIKPLQEKIFDHGELVYQQPTLPEIQKYCREQIDTLWDEVKRFENPHNYYVDLSQKLWDIKQDLLRKNYR